MIKRVVFITLSVAIAVVAALGILRFIGTKRNSLLQPANVESRVKELGPDAWNKAVEKVKADRGDLGGRSSPAETPPELRHYSDRHWFLATQVAEIAKYDIHTCQDFVDLAAMIERGDLVSVPAVTDSYVLYGVAERADDSVFSRYENGESVEVYTDAQLNEAYRSIKDRRTKLENEIADLKHQSVKLKKGERARQNELQRQISARENDLKATDEEKARLDQSYGQPSQRQKLVSDYNALEALAKNFAGRSYNIDQPSDRLEMKINMLRALRPVALKVMEEVAAAYHREFDRPLPVSSLVRPEQYQRALRRVNRNAVLIETPPHSTGLAFDIDYRYMSGPEQTFVMRELARLEQQGRIEVIRESNANYHVFAFLNGARPSDDLIAASVDKASEQPGQAAHHAESKAANVKPKRVKAANKKKKAATRKSSPRSRRR